MQMHLLQPMQRCAYRQLLCTASTALWFSCITDPNSKRTRHSARCRRYTSVNDLLTPTKSIIYISSRPTCSHIHRICCSVRTNAARFILAGSHLSAEVFSEFRYLPHRHPVGSYFLSLPSTRSGGRCHRRRRSVRSNGTESLESNRPTDGKVRQASVNRRPVRTHSNLQSQTGASDSPLPRHQTSSSERAVALFENHPQPADAPLRADSLIHRL